MSGYRWLQADEVLLFHEECIQETGGSKGVRDKSLLESALAKPQNLAAYEKPSVYELAASYAEGIARNHPFVDGNKRTALAAAWDFLDNHSIELAPERDNELTEMVEGLAQGTVSREAFANHLRANSSELQNVRHLDPEQERQAGNEVLLSEPEAAESAEAEAEAGPEIAQAQDSALSAEASAFTPEQDYQAEIDALRAWREARDAEGHEQDGPERGR